LRAYAADMNLAQVALQEHNLARAIQLLDQWIPNDGVVRTSLRHDSVAEKSSSQFPADPRGWEWNYLRSQCHSDELATLTGAGSKHSGFVSSVACSPDGKLLASAGYDGQVKLFDLATRREVAALTHQKTVRAVAFSPRDSTLV